MRYNVGETVTFNCLHLKSHGKILSGIVLGNLDDNYAIRIPDFSLGHSCGGRFGIHTFSTDCWWVPETDILFGPSLTKEQRIANKCKNLWNKSQWVKKNPHLAY